MAAVGVLAAAFVALVLLTRVRYFRYLIWVAHDRPTALQRGCRICGATAVHATWHVRAPSYLRPFGPSETVAWCQGHYEQAQARRQASRSRPVK
jgi:hypothetical protein